MTAEEDMKRVLSYRVHVARQKNFFGSMEKKINTWDLKNIEGRTEKLYSLTAIGTLECDLTHSL